jgi:LysM repeat protein
MKAGRSISAGLVGILLFLALGAQALAATTYTVKAGDWLSKIAKTYGVTVEQLKQYNSLKSDAIYVGQKLIVSPDTKYVVKKGDTLSKIASKYSTTIAKIKTRNNLKSDAIYVNQVLYIPSAGKTSTPSTTEPGSSSKPVTSWPSVTYTVKSGDTLGGIAKKFGTTIAKLMKYNYMDSGEWLNASQKIAINGYAPRNYAVTPGESSAPKKVGKLVDWFLDGKYLIKRNDVFLVTDVATGQQIKFKMMGGVNHADVEPLTSDETAKMKKLFPAWNWTPRPAVIFHKGINFAASLSGMPHSYDTVSNGVDGHFDLYLYNSKNHGESVSQAYVQQHRDNVLIAAGK